MISSNHECTNGSLFIYLSIFSVHKVKPKKSINICQKKVCNSVNIEFKSMKFCIHQVLSNLYWYVKSSQNRIEINWNKNKLVS